MQALAPQALFEAAFDDREPGRLAVMLSEAFGGRSSMIHTLRPTGDVEPISASYFGPEILAGFPLFAHLDPWTRIAPSVPAADAVRMSDHIDVEAYRESAFYQEFVRPMGDDTAYCMAAIFPAADGLGAVAFHRGYGQGDFRAEDRDAFQAHLPALGKLLEVRSRLAGAERQVRRFSASLDAWPRAILHVGQRNRLTYANSAAEAILARADAFRLHEGRLSGTGPTAAKLDEAIQRALRHGEGAAFTLGRSEASRGYLVTVAPLFSPAAQGTVALVSIDDPQAPEGPAIEEYMAFFGLTRAEGAIAAALVEGASLEEISAARSIQIGTARVHLKHVLQKTGARRQAQLVSILKGVPRLPR